MKYYFCKYIPPRANFLPTLSDQEKQWMGEHGAFLDDLLAKGTIIAHGPVVGPGETFGLSLFRVDDDQDIAAITAQDPIVKHGLGHYEHHVMLHIRS